MLFPAPGLWEDRRAVPLLKLLISFAIQPSPETDPLNGCIQVHVTELSQTARGAAASLHSSFFYLGQAVGPVVYGYGFAMAGRSQAFSSARRW
jgi:predicted MFS family arabinose efflux permease